MKNKQTEMRFECDTYSCMRDHNVAGAVVALLTNFIQPIFGLWIVSECVDHIGGVALYGSRAALHSVWGFLLLYFASSSCVWQTNEFSQLRSVKICVSDCFLVDCLVFFANIITLISAISNCSR